VVVLKQINNATERFLTINIGGTNSETKHKLTSISAQLEMFCF